MAIVRARDQSRREVVTLFYGLNKIPGLPLIPKPRAKTSFGHLKREPIISYTFYIFAIVGVCCAHSAQ